MFETISVSCALFGVVLIIMGAAKQSAPTVSCGILLLCGIIFFGDHLLFTILSVMIVGIIILGLAFKWGLIKDYPYEE